MLNLRIEIIRDQLYNHSRSCKEHKKSKVVSNYLTVQSWNQISRENEESKLKKVLLLIKLGKSSKFWLYTEKKEAFK